MNVTNLELVTFFDHKNSENSEPSKRVVLTSIKVLSFKLECRNTPTIWLHRAIFSITTPSFSFIDVRISFCIIFIFHQFYPVILIHTQFHRKLIFFYQKRSIVGCRTIFFLNRMKSINRNWNWNVISWVRCTYEPSKTADTSIYFNIFHHVGITHWKNASNSKKIFISVGYHFK